jgi:hypothetical protein
VKDGAGLTPLHLAAIAPDECMAERLLQTCQCSPSTWFTASAADGLTPAHFAARIGRHSLNARILLLAQANKVVPIACTLDCARCSAIISYSTPTA